MSLKKIISKKILEKGDKKIINTDETTHTRISLLADLFDATKLQVIHNIVNEFCIDNEEEIKAKIEIKKKELDQIF